MLLTHHEPFQPAPECSIGFESTNWMQCHWVTPKLQQKADAEHRRNVTGMIQGPLSAQQAQLSQHVKPCPVGCCL